MYNPAAFRSSCSLIRTNQGRLFLVIILFLRLASVREVLGHSFAKLFVERIFVVKFVIIKLLTSDFVENAAIDLVILRVKVISQVVYHLSNLCLSLPNGRGSL